MDLNATLERMTMEEILSYVDGLGSVLTVRPAPGDGSPEISWGDAFCYYAPDGMNPTEPQPFATIVTKDCPGDESSRLDRPGTFRVNVAAGRKAFARWTRDAPDDDAATDRLIAHPVYGAMSWLAVVNPGPRTAAVTCELLREAHRLARARHERRAENC